MPAEMSPLNLIRSMMRSIWVRVADLAASVEEAMKELSWLVGNWQMRGLGSDWSGLALVWMVFFLMLKRKNEGKFRRYYSRFEC